jgi:predicted lipoprotein
MKALLFMLSLLSFFLLSQTVNAATWAETNLAVVDQYAVPAYQKLYQNSQQLQKSNEAFCTELSDKSFTQLQDSFHNTMDTWQFIQTFRLGPAGKFMRSFRLEMWPDRSNAAAKHLRKLLAETNPRNLEPAQFIKASVAVQGLSAMERILFAKDSSYKDYQTEGKANFRCQLLSAISLNVQSISKDLLSAWENEYRDIIAKPSKDNDFFETDKEVASQFLNELSTQLQAVIEQKFDRPIAGDKFLVTKAESWRSQRSLRNIVLNLQSTQSLYKTAFAPHIADENLRKKQLALFDTALLVGKDLMMPLASAYADKRDALQDWIEAIKNLKNSISTELPTAIDIQLGFNSLDGD